MLDADVLYSAAVRDLLIRLGIAGLVRPRWTARILDEAFIALRRTRPDIAPPALARTRTLMDEALPDALVAGRTVTLDISLPDPGDVHVVAAAIRAEAKFIVTRNVRHFPSRALAPFGIKAISPDEFVLDLINADAERVSAVVHGLQLDLRNPPISFDRLLAILHRDGLPRAAGRLRHVG